MSTQPGTLPRRRPLIRQAGRKLRGLWQARELLKNLAARDLKVRYKNSALGFGWTMLTPVAMLLVFTFIFTKVFRSPIDHFPVFFLAGFLPWTYFSNSVVGSVGAIVSNGNLIKKVYFPREVLPLSTVAAQGVHFLLSLTVFAVYMLIEGFNFLPFLPLVIAAFLLQTMFNAGFAMAFAAGNVSFRDLTELVQVIFLVWFYGTPIIYSLDNVPERYQFIIQANPMSWFIEFYRQLLYHLSLPSLKVVGICAGSSVLALVVGYTLFSRLAVTFAKEV